MDDYDRKLFRTAYRGRMSWRSELERLFRGAFYREPIGLAYFALGAVISLGISMLGLVLSMGWALFETLT